MPVINYTLPDPTDILILGESMRASVRDEVRSPPKFLPGAPNPTGFFSLVRDDDAYPPMNTVIECAVLSIHRMANGQLQIRNNAGIVTPCGAWIWLDYTPLINTYLGSSGRWVIIGVTRDSASAPLANCRVVVLETGRLARGESAIVAEGISDGSGNYSIEVPTNTAYQVISYKPGAPDVAGITRSDVVPTANG